MEKNFSEKIEIARTSIIDRLTQVKESPDLLGFASCFYIAFQTICAEIMKPEEKHVDTQLLNRINNVNFRLAVDMPDLADDFRSLIAAEGKKDFVISFVFPIVRHYVDKQNELAIDGDPVIDLNDDAVSGYLFASCCTLLRIAYNQLSADEIIDYIKYDKVDDFSIDATDPRQSYEWVRNEFGIECSDISAFNRMMAEMEPLDEADQEEALNLIDGMKSMAKELLTMLAIPSLIPDESEEEKERVTARMTEMLADEHHAEQLNGFFILGLTFLPLIPKSFDLQRSLATADGRDRLFDSYYKCFVGSEPKDYYEKLDDLEKTVARIAWLGGLSIISGISELGKDENSQCGFRQGAMFSL